MSKKLLNLNCTIVHETEKAVLVTADIGEDVWIPKSLCEIEKKRPNDQPPCAATITIAENVAISKGLI